MNDIGMVINWIGVSVVVFGLLFAGIRIREWIWYYRRRGQEVPIKEYEKLETVSTVFRREK